MFIHRLLFAVLAYAAVAPLLAKGPAVLSSGRVEFDRPDGAYRVADFSQDFGNFRTDDCYADIFDQSLRIRFPAGKKIEGLQGARVRIQPTKECRLQFRVRYPEQFEADLHGKQFGMGGGASYTGGQGKQARERGDGWSVRLQFDAHDRDITNQLYVYHAGMRGKYGDDLGSSQYQLHLKRGKWHTIALRATMQSSVNSSDGQIEAWQDGVRKIYVKDFQFVTKPRGAVIDQLLLEAFCGGYGKIPDSDNFVYFDDISWETK